jgi:hypothetical protein
VTRGVNADDLPLTVEQRKALGIPAVPKTQRKRRKPSRAEAGPPTPGSCASCEWTGTQRQHEKHHAETGHTRWEAELR